MSLEEIGAQGNLTLLIIYVMRQDRGRQWTNQDANDLSLERMQIRERESMDPKIMPTGMTR